MLEEFRGVTQERAAGTRRRWFQDDGMDLIVWYEADHVPTGFQLCYRGDDGGERALTWRKEAGFSHARIDPGDSRPDKNLSPILLPGGEVEWEKVSREFTARSGGLESAVGELVRGALRER